jgi:hypothetical protein
MKLDALYICIIAAIIVMLAYAYITSDYYYIHVIMKNAFHELKHGDNFRKLNPDVNWTVINMDIDGYINNKKIVTNKPHHEVANTAHAKNEFENKNTMAAFLNNVVVFDIDSNEPLTIVGATGMDEKPIDQYLPKDTVIAKTPHGFHFYFYNDTNDPIPCFVGLKMNGIKYPVDLLTGHKQLIFMPPTRIESACYRWINAPTTHKMAPISKHARILDLFAYTKEFEIQPEVPNMCVSNAIPHLLCIVWEFNIIYQLKYKCVSTTFEKLDVNQHEMLYRTKTTYYLFLKHAPLKHFSAQQFVSRIARLIHKYNINGGIVHLCSGTSHSAPRNIMQFSSCQVHNHRKHQLPSPMLKANHTLLQTSAFTHQPALIISHDVLHEDLYEITPNHNHNNNNMIVNEDLFLIIELSNKTKVPCVCLMQIIPPGKSNDEIKYTKLVQFYMHNVLNATHHTKHPQKALPFFSEVNLSLLTND